MWVEGPESDKQKKGAFAQQMPSFFIELWLYD